jgi:hypothetical protein
LHDAEVAAFMFAQHTTHLRSALCESDEKLAQFLGCQVGRIAVCGKDLTDDAYGLKPSIKSNT